MRNTIETEIMGCAENCTKYMVPIISILEQIWGHILTNRLFVDNAIAVLSIRTGLSKPLPYMCRTQHISLGFLSDYIADGNGRWKIDGELNPTDLLSKAFEYAKHWHHKIYLGLG